MDRPTLKYLKTLYATATPGRWYVEQPRKKIRVRSEQLPPSAQGDAFVFEFDYGTTYLEANARLAAALHNALPELLRAVEDCEATEAQVGPLGELFHAPPGGRRSELCMIPYWTDLCPVCGGKCVAACRCLLNDRTCANHHFWRRDKNDKAIVLTAMHGQPIDAPTPESGRTAE